MNVTIVRGDEADTLLAAEEFRAEWERLADACPWATPYQRRAFARPWYATYRERYEPMLVLSYAADGSLQGLLPLAVLRSGSEVVVAGAWQAEYQCWIALEMVGEAFGHSAMQAMRDALPGSTLAFRYIPRGTPLSFVADHDNRARCLLQSHRRPLLRFEDGAAIAASLKKSGNKRRLRDLQNLGGIRFEHITDPLRLDSCLDQLISFHDLRHMAVRGSAPFRNDPLKRAFHRALMDEFTISHVTVLSAGETVAAAHLGVRARGTLHLGLIAHNPLLARQSPGKFLIYYLAQMLFGEGDAQIDLTPGGDTYKERFANAWDEVHMLTIFPSRRARAAGRAATGIRQATKQALATCCLTPHQVKAQLELLTPRFLPSIPSRITSAAARRIYSEHRTQIYRIPLRLGGELPPPRERIQRDALDDLLSCSLNDVTGASRRAFISIALRRIEAGQHLYTYVESGRLLHTCWLAESLLDPGVAEQVSDLALASDCALVLGSSTAEAARGRSLELASLLAMLRDASRMPVAKQVVVLADSREVAAAAESAGGQHEGTLVTRVRAGRVRRQFIRHPPREQVTVPDAAATTAIPIIDKSYLNPGGVK